MNAATKIGLLLSLLGALVFPLATWGTSFGGIALTAALAGLVGVGAGFHLLRQERYPIGAWVYGIGSLLLFPAGAVGAIGAYLAWQSNKYGTTIGRKAPAVRPRPRPWTLGTIVFATAASASLTWALVHPRLVASGDIVEPAVAVAAGIMGVLCGIEAVLLWTRNDEAVRLGMVLSIVMFAVCLLVGFYLQNYFAVAMLALPIYGAYLVWSGRERWDGIDRSGPGIEGRGRQSRAVPS